MKEITNKKGETILEITRQEIIDIFLEDDLETIQSGEGNVYFFDIMRDGFCGYKKYTNKDLAAEYRDRIDDSLITIKIIKE